MRVLEGLGLTEDRGPIMLPVYMGSAPATAYRCLA